MRRRIVAPRVSQLGDAPGMTPARPMAQTLLAEPRWKQKAGGAVTIETKSPGL
jgi:hypothetical protein